MTETKKHLPGKKKLPLSRVFKYLLLFLLIISLGLAFFIKDRDMATGMITKAIINGLASAGFDGNIERVTGNPWKGYRIEGLDFASGDIFSASIRTIEIDLDLLKIFNWDPVEKIGLYDSMIDIRDPAKLALLRSEPSGKKLPIPPLPLEIESFDVRIPGHQVLADRGSILYSSRAIDMDISGRVDTLPWKMGTVLEMGDRIHLAKGMFDLGAEGRIILSGDISPLMDITGTVESLDLYALSSLDKRFMDARGIFSSTLYGKGTPSEPEAGGTFSLAGGEIGGRSMGSISGRWSFAENTFRIDEMVNEILGSRIEGDLSINTEGELKLKAQGRDLDLSKAQELKMAIPEMNGRIDTLQLNLSGKLPWLTGRVDLVSGGFSVSAQKFDSMNLNILLEGKKILLDSSLSWSGTRAQAGGTLDLSKEPALEFSLKAPVIDLAILPKMAPSLSALEPEGSMALSLEVRGSIRDPDIKGSLSSRKFSIRKEPIEDLSLSFSVVKGTLNMDRLYAKMLGGELTGRGEILDIFASPLLDLGVYGKDLDLERASRLVPSPPEDLGGRADLEAHIRGSLENPLIEGTLQGRQFRMGDLVRVETIDAKVSKKGQEEPVLEISTPLATISDVVLQDVNASISWKAPDLIIQNISTSILDGEFSAAGRIITAPSPLLDLQASFENLELEDLPFAGLPETEGTTKGTLTIKGPPSDPEISFQALSPLVSSGCAELRSIDLRGNASRKKIDITSVSAKVGEGLLKGGMSLILLEKGTDIYFNLAGSGLDLAYLLPGEDGSCPVDISGNIDLQIQGDFTKGKLNGEGDISSQALVIQNFALESMDIPLDITANKAEIKGMKISAFGGTLSGDLSLNFDDLQWNSSFEGADLDLARAMDTIPALSKKLTGKTFFDVKFKGKGFNPYNLFGYGLLEIREGDIGDIPAIKAAAATAGEERIRFQRLRSNFLADGFGLTILGGSRVEAPRKYPLYRQIEMDGNIQYDGDLDLKGAAEVNIQAFNAFMGTLQIALKTVLSQGDLVQDILGSLTGIGRKDFRTINFEIGGNRTSPEIKKLEVEGGQEYLSNLLDMEDSDKDRQKVDNRQITIKLNFPVGPGGSKKDDETGEQLQEQFLEGILKNLFPKE